MINYNIFKNYHLGLIIIESTLMLAYILKAIHTRSTNYSHLHQTGHVSYLLHCLVTHPVNGIYLHLVKACYLDTWCISEPMGSFRRYSIHRPILQSHSFRIKTLLDFSTNTFITTKLSHIYVKLELE